MLTKEYCQSIPMSWFPDYINRAAKYNWGDTGTLVSLL